MILIRKQIKVMFINYIYIYKCKLCNRHVVLFICLGFIICQNLYKYAVLEREREREKFRTTSLFYYHLIKLEKKRFLFDIL